MKKFLLLMITLAACDALSLETSLIHVSFNDLLSFDCPYQEGWFKKATESLVFVSGLLDYPRQTYDHALSFYRDDIIIGKVVYSYWCLSQLSADDFKSIDHHDLLRIETIVKTIEKQCADLSSSFTDSYVTPVKEMLKRLRILVDYLITSSSYFSL